nr:hypothetical protein Q903MT_gene3029 [Picea sitchensis]
MKTASLLQYFVPSGASLMVGSRTQLASSVGLKLISCFRGNGNSHPEEERLDQTN